MDDKRSLSQYINNALSRILHRQTQTHISKPLYLDAHKQVKEERHFCVSLAGHVFAIDSLYSEVYSLCKDYLCEQEPEVHISICDNDIEYEYALTQRNRASNAESYMETLSVYRKISEAMLDFDGFLMHGAVIAVDNAAYLFTAKSGTGKTTHIRKWIKNLENAYVVNGDKPIITIKDEEAIANGTPWCGKEHMGTNTMVPLKAIVQMERGENNIIEEISFDTAFPQLLQQTYRPEGFEQIKKTISLLSKLNGKTKFYRFIFNNMKEDAFITSYEALTGKKE